MTFAEFFSRLMRALNPKATEPEGFHCRPLLVLQNDKVRYFGDADLEFQPADGSWQKGKLLVSYASPSDCPVEFRTVKYSRGRSAARYGRGGMSFTAYGGRERYKLLTGGAAENSALAHRVLANEPAPVVLEPPFDETGIL